MEGYGTYDMPPGTWSDDGSMTVATLDSLIRKKGVDYNDIMSCFVSWDYEGKYTPAGEAFDQGNTCSEAIYNYRNNRDYKTCGKTGEYANGNGALMRIMPICLYAHKQYESKQISLEEAVEYVHQATALTHDHLRAKIASGIYFFMVQAIIEGEGSLNHRLQEGMDHAKSFYFVHSEYANEWLHYKRMENFAEFAAVAEKDIISSGYVVESLEAAVWSLITTKTFERGILKAVNLGDDTDTIGAIAGGLAALYYGYENIPVDWIEEIIKKEEILALCYQAEEVLG